MVKPILIPPSARRTRGETVIEKLRREILLGRHQPGTRLPPERELAQRFGTNRNTLREALRTLESENLLRARQGDGTLVLDWRSVGEITLLPHFLGEETPMRERFDALTVLLHLRDGLIDQALGIASEAADDVDLRTLRSALDGVRTAEPGLSAIRADIEFYRHIVLATHSTVLVWVFNTFARIFSQLAERYPGLWRIDDAYCDQLDEIVRALVAKRGNRARELMQEMFNQRNSELLNQLVPLEPSDGIVVVDVARNRPRRKRK